MLSSNTTERRVDTQKTDIRVYGTAPDSIVDGPGLRFAVFVQGCSHACPGCHNPKSQPAEGGELLTVEDLVERIAANPLNKNVTISGGEPFEQPEACAELATFCKEHGWGVWTYTGYLYEDLLRMAEERPAIKTLLDMSDVLIDGPFIMAKRHYDLKWKGSSNQRVIDLAATRAAGAVTLWQPHDLGFEKPTSW